jgi:hypothetical protein
MGDLIKIVLVVKILMDYFRIVVSIAQLVTFNNRISVIK